MIIKMTKKELSKKYCKDFKKGTTINFKKIIYNGKVRYYISNSLNALDEFLVMNNIFIKNGAYYFFQNKKA